MLDHFFYVDDLDEGGLFHAFGVFLLVGVGFEVVLSQADGGSGKMEELLM